MTVNGLTDSKNMLASDGGIEPHAALLNVPDEGQLLYKVMTVENLMSSIIGNYLHFNRVDTYKDFHSADPDDGKQLPKDEPGNAGSCFEGAPNFTVSDYYDQSRARTYACCFSVQNSDIFRKRYGNNSAYGKVSIIFKFGKLRTAINRTLQQRNCVLEFDGKQFQDQIFSVNYGMIEYIDRNNYQANTERFPTPIKYTYYKDKKYSDEKEFRISLSAIGMDPFVLNDGGIIRFQPSLQLGFDFKTAIMDQTIQKILYAPDCNYRFLLSELRKNHIIPHSLSKAG